MKKEQYVTTENLSISESLYKFVNDKLLSGTRIKTKDFWNLQKPKNQRFL